jgi:hypothetical protein
MRNVSHQQIQMPFGNGQSEEKGAARHAVAAIVGHGVSSWNRWVFIKGFARVSSKV